MTVEQFCDGVFSSNNLMAPEAGTSTQTSTKKRRRPSSGWLQEFNTAPPSVQPHAHAQYFLIHSLTHTVSTLIYSEQLDLPHWTTTHRHAPPLQCLHGCYLCLPDRDWLPGNAIDCFLTCQRLNKASFLPKDCKNKGCLVQIASMELNSRKKNKIVMSKLFVFIQMCSQLKTNKKPKHSKRGGSSKTSNSFLSVL